jgi:hypothetical protein
MPYLLSEWRAHIQEVWGEYQAAKFAVLRLHEQVNADANIVAGEHGVREYLSSADTNLEGTYIVRIFAHLRRRCVLMTGIISTIRNVRQELQP